MTDQKREEYEVGVPSEEVWVFRVWATSKEDAIERVANGGGEKIGSYGGVKPYVQIVKKEE